MPIRLRTIAVIAAAASAVLSQAAAAQEEQENGRFHKRHIPYRPDRPVSHYYMFFLQR